MTLQQLGVSRATSEIPASKLMARSCSQAVTGLQAQVRDGMAFIAAGAAVLSPGAAGRIHM